MEAIAINDVLSAIGSVGFPIVMCIMLCWYIKDEQGKTREVINSLENAIKVLQKSFDTFYRIKSNEEEE